MADLRCSSPEESLVLRAEAWWWRAIAGLDGIFDIGTETDGHKELLDGRSDVKNDFLLDVYVWKCIDTEIATGSHCMIWQGKHM